MATAVDIVDHLLTIFKISDYCTVRQFLDLSIELANYVKIGKMRTSAFSGKQSLQMAASPSLEFGFAMRQVLFSCCLLVAERIDQEIALLIQLLVIPKPLGVLSHNF